MAEQLSINDIFFAPPKRKFYICVPIIQYSIRNPYVVSTENNNRIYLLLNFTVNGSEYSTGNRNLSLYLI